MASLADHSTSAEPPDGSPAAAPAAESAYGPTFWWCYAANTLLMVAVSLLFRYSDFVKYLGASEGWLGLVVGAGAVGAIANRAVQGVAIDRCGAGRVWMASQAIMLAAIGTHLLVSSAYGPLIFIGRIFLTAGIAGSFGASLTFISLRVPQRRVAEMVGMLGSSGFVGMALGPALGDWIMSAGTVSAGDIRRMFLFAAAAVTCSIACAFMASRKTPVRKPSRQPPPWLLLRRYHPGMILLVSAAMGIGFTLPHVFLKAYADEMQIEGIKWFFITYAAFAFAVRIASRKATERLGVKRTIMLGFAFLCASMLAYLPATTSLWLALPAALGGTAHAFLFPAVVAGGSTTFPQRYRGLATTLVLAMFDLGNLVGHPAVGGAIETARWLGWPPYAAMFVGMSMVMATIAAAYALSPGRVRQVASVRKKSREESRQLLAKTHERA